MEQVKKSTIPEDKRVVYPDVVITLNIHRAVKQLTTIDKVRKKGNNS